MNKIYKDIKTEKIGVDTRDFTSLPEDMKAYAIVYTGKHKAFLKNVASELSEEDLDVHLLIECRLFNEEEEIFIFPRQGKLRQRIIKQGGTEVNFIEKNIQLRNEEGKKGSENTKLLVRHYINTLNGAYEMLRFVSIDNKN